MKKNFSLLAAAMFTAAAFTFVSCGDDGGKPVNDSTKDSMAVKEEPKGPEFSEVCKDGNKISMTIKGYKYGMSGNYAFETANFEVKQSTWNMKNDSTAELKLSNYAAADLVGDRKDNQVDIMIELHTKGGKKIGPGTYGYQDYDSGMYSMVTMQTAKGTVYFNWVADMPEQGNVILNYGDNSKACGSFALAVEKPTSEQIGTVRLNGAFQVGE
jgi:hypothetical protein